MRPVSPTPDPAGCIARWSAPTSSRRGSPGGMNAVLFDLERANSARIYCKAHGFAALTAFAALLLLISAAGTTAFAGSATWDLNPVSGNWNHAANWTPATIPNGASDIATFGSSSKTNVSISAATTVDGIIFNSGASPFTITASSGLSLTIVGAGITNNSATEQD